MPIAWALMHHGTAAGWGVAIALAARIRVLRRTHARRACRRHPAGAVVAGTRLVRLEDGTTPGEWRGCWLMFQRTVLNLLLPLSLLPEACGGGFSPGSAVGGTLASGRRAFIKAVDSAAHPDSAALHRREAAV
ncbi:hypothetical protein [Paeniglutamicibacter cryotolerans]|uniref:Uncharacterized protein n=1 Tax=Paeniglutamicibacter cryotolerans TaxID=670079 RepID=A0A839QGZ2_9MICC|nr:hypothetical protein [Paeniglutamicibacter cryotolerans]MBB2994997.1 hypothetical protein [Paeniglutamicibacter cryotolerans]